MRPDLHSLALAVYLASGGLPPARRVWRANLAARHLVFLEES
jgi:hypothetical protein